MTPADTIILKLGPLHGKHGVYDSERTTGNEFDVEITAKGSFREAAAGDDLSATFNYENAAEVVQTILAGPSKKLIETLCEEIGDTLFQNHPQLQSLTVTVRKHNPPLPIPTRSAEVIFVWKRSL
ncbi:MAG: dihydroneopterin aldolase [Balneolaceae bacterium]